LRYQHSNELKGLALLIPFDLVAFLLDAIEYEAYIQSLIESIKEERIRHEKNISAIECKESQRSWFQKENVHQGGKKSSEKTQG
jgi:hypothetical protein